MPEVSPVRVWIGLVIVYIVWGSTYLGIAISVETIPPLLSGGLRFTLAGTLLAIGLTIRRGGARSLRVTVRQFASAGLVGILLLTGGNAMVVLAQSGPIGDPVPSGIAALLVATVPLLVVVFRLATGDRPRTTTTVGVTVGFAGLAGLILSRGGGGGVVPVVGALIVLAAALCWAVGSFISSRLALPPDPFVATVYEMLIGGGLTVVIGLLVGERLWFGDGSARSWWAMAYLTAFGSLLAFTAYVWLLGNAPISLISTYAYVNPAVAVLLGALLLDERITGSVLLSGAVIVGGVALVVSTERRGSPSPSTATGRDGSDR